MIVAEGMLAPFRGADGLCRLRRDPGEFGALLRNANLPVLIERMRRDPAPPPLLKGAVRPTPEYLGALLRYANFPAESKSPPLLEGGVKPTPTFGAFREIWSQAPPGSRAVPVLAFTDRVPPLPATREWLALEHQCAGHLCGQVPMIATVLRAPGAMQAGFDRIAAENYGASHGWFESAETDEDVTRRYLDRIAELGLGCSKAALGFLRESVYPVDATPAALCLVATDANDLLPLLGRSDAEPLILLLSENSD